MTKDYGPAGIEYTAVEIFMAWTQSQTMQKKTLVYLQR